MAQKVGDDESRLHPYLNRGCTEYMSAAHDKATLSTHVDLPALHVEVMSAVHLQDHTPPILQPPFSVEITHPTVRINAPDLPIRLLKAKAAADSYQVNFAQGL
jgi:hypothetical protein